MIGTEASNVAEQLLQNHELHPPVTWVKPLVFNLGTQGTDEAHLRALNGYSQNILRTIILGKNDDNKNRFLREIYWRTIEILAHQE